MPMFRLLMNGRTVADFEAAVAEYRAGEGGGAHPVKISGAYKVNDVTLKRGVIADASLANWLKSARTKHHFVLQKIDGVGRVVGSWTLANSMVTKYTGPTLNGKGNDIAIEELEIAHEGLSLPIR
jgi:phage tail-like protein